MAIKRSKSYRLFFLPMLRTAFVVVRKCKETSCIVKPVGFLSALGTKCVLTKRKEVNADIMRKIGHHICSYGQQSVITKFINGSDDILQLKKRKACEEFLLYISLAPCSDDAWMCYSPLYGNNDRLVNEFVLFWLASFTQVDAPSINEVYCDENAQILDFDKLHQAKESLLALVRVNSEKGKNR